MGHRFRYDQLNRIKTSLFEYYSGGWNTTDDYKSTYTYDANGNITSLNRKGYAANPTYGREMDDFTYNRIAGTNKLEYIDDAVAAVNYGTDIDDQSAGNFKYDKLGNLVENISENVDTVLWTVYGKVDMVVKDNSDTLDFTYDAAGNRISKSFKPNGGAETVTYYVRDASGNVMAVYERTENGDNHEYRQMDVPIYGSARIGIRRDSILVKTRPKCIPCSGGNGNDECIYYKEKFHVGDVTLMPVDLDNIGRSIYTRPINKKRFELNDHLGNVRAVISDKRQTDSTASVISYSNYYPFGMMQVGRVQPGNEIGGDGYRWAFNGKEATTEWENHTGTMYDYGFRIYDPRCGCFLSVDPLFQSYPWLSTYQFAQNDPVRNIDIDGLEGGSAIEYWLTGVGRQMEAWWNSWTWLPSTAPSKPAPPVNTDMSQPTLQKTTADKVEEKTEKTSNASVKGSINLKDKIKFISQFDSRFGTKKEQKGACCKAGKAIIEGAGYTPGSSTNRIDVVIESADKTKLIKTGDAAKGVKAIDKSLEAGKPIQVGVDHTLDYGKNNHNVATDHFVVIYAREYDAEKKQTYYLFAEVGSSSESRGLSDKNRLYLGADGLLKSRDSFSTEKTFTVTEVRPTQ